MFWVAWGTGILPLIYRWWTSLGCILGDDKGNIWVIKVSGVDVVGEAGLKGFEALCDQVADEIGKDRMKFAGS